MFVAGALEGLAPRRAEGRLHALSDPLGEDAACGHNQRQHYGLLCESIHRYAQRYNPRRRSGRAGAGWAHPTDHQVALCPVHRRCLVAIFD